LLSGEVIKMPTVALATNKCPAFVKLGISLQIKTFTKLKKLA